MKAELYINKIALPDIQKFAKDINLHITWGNEIIQGKFINLHISFPSESTVISFIHCIGIIEGRAEVKINK